MSGSITVTLKGRDKPVLNVGGGGGKLTLRAGAAHSTTYYPALTGKPSIEGHELLGDSTIQQIGVGTLSVTEIEKILYLG